MNVDDAALGAAIAVAVQRAMDPYDRQLRTLQDNSARFAENVRADAARATVIANEDRDRLAIQVRGDAERHAKEIAEEVVKQMMLSLGLDSAKPKDFIQDMLFVQELRKTFVTAKNHAITVIVGVIMLGIATGVWQMVKGAK